MRYFISIIMLTIPSWIVAQDRGDKNDKPEIIGQKPLGTLEDEKITIELSDLYVFDWDDYYPFGFSLQLYGGNNFTYNGATVIPAANFSGTLTVPVTVNDGEDNSKKFDLKIDVRSTNDIPSITAQRALSIDENQSITLQLGDLSVTDPDDNYPDGFSLSVSQGSNYVVSGTRVTPVENFSGTLSVPVRVYDGADYSSPFQVKIEVRPVSKVPQIVGQVELKIDEDETFVIKFAHLKVNDSDDEYPDGFSLIVSGGPNYTLPEANTIKPANNFFGSLVVPVKVSDGTNVSESFNLLITVRSVNDVPLITNIESRALQYEFAKGAINITDEFVAVDADDDSLVSGEIKFDAAFYQEGIDQLMFTDTRNITGTFDANRGSLSLVGKAPIGEYVAAIRRVEYAYLAAGDSTLADKKLLFTVHDGKSASTTQERRIVLSNTFAAFDVPTGFTPNGDLVNDTWSVRPSKHSDQYAKPLIRVYNRWGVVVYEATGYDNEWDGRFKGEFLPTDTYFYTIDLNLIDSKSTYNGLVTILR